MKPPVKPFSNYKWRWATLTCTEGLNEPSVYLGILRAMRTHEGQKPSSPALLQTLRRVEEQTYTSVSLARSGKRNIIRNSGQYWKALDVMAESRQGIELTAFGRSVADGRITPVEFATTIINRLALPNHRIDQRASEWGQLRIKPLQIVLLVLQILADLNQAEGMAQAYITPRELIDITIPLAGEDAPILKHVNAILLFRNGKLDISAWPDCAPGANDKRMVREFLLFLSYYGFCGQPEDANRLDEKYYLASIEVQEISALIEIDTSGLATVDASQQIIDSQLPASIERKRVLTSTLYRPNQARFRANVLSAFSGTCFLTGVQIPAVLEAAHIIPVSSHGTDIISNGLCLRTDVHRLYDSGHLRFSPDGQIHLSESASQKRNYGSLPNTVIFPDFIEMNNIAWRWEYT